MVVVVVVAVAAVVVVVDDADDVDDADADVDVYVIDNVYLCHYFFYRYLDIIIIVLGCGPRFELP